MRLSDPISADANSHHLFLEEPKFIQCAKLNIFASPLCQAARGARRPCSVPGGISGGFPWKPLFSCHGFSLFPPPYSRLSAWITNVIPGGAATILQPSVKTKASSQDGGSRKQKKPDEPLYQSWTALEFVLHRASLLFNLLFSSFCDSWLNSFLNATLCHTTFFLSFILIYSKLALPTCTPRHDNYSSVLCACP